jgi:nitrogen regulatory protein P-II 1
LKKIEANINTYKLDIVKENLLNAGIIGMTISEVRIFGRNKKDARVYRGNEYTADFSTRIKVEAIVEDSLVDIVVQELAAAARTGELGDGKIFVSLIEETIRIRTEEKGTEAL